MRDTIGKLCTNLNMHHNLFPIQNFVHTYTCNSKTTLYRLYMDVLHIEWLVYYRRCLFFVRAGCEWQMARYGSKHTSQSLSNKPFVHTYTQNLKTSGHTVYMYGCSAYQMTAILLETFFVWFKITWKIQLESSTPDTHRSFSDATLCVHTASSYIHVHRYLLCNYA